MSGADRADARRGPGFALAYAGGFGALASGLLAALFVAARSGLPTPPRLAPACFALFCAFAFAPFALPARARAACLRTPSRAAFASLAALASPAALLLTGAAAAVLLLLVALLGLRGALLHLRGIRPGEAGLLALAPPLLALYLFASVHPFPFAHVFRPELARLDALTGDAILNAALAHLVQATGRATSGLDGFVPIHYHLGSHLWLAGVGLATGAAPLVAQPAAMMIAIAPALVTSLFFAIACLAPSEAGIARRIVAALALVLLFDRIGWDAYWVSESHALGLCAILLSLPIVRDLSLAGTARAPGSELWRASAALAGVGIAAVAKISAGAILAAALGWGWLRRHGASRRSAALLVPLGVVVLAAGALVSPRAGVDAPSFFAPLDFYRRFDPFDYTGEELLDPRKAHTSVLLPLLFLAIAAWRHGPAREAERRRSAAELVLVTTAVALAPGLVLALAHDAWWFQNAAQWIALAFAAAALPLAPPGEGRGRGAAPLLALCGLLAAALVASRIREIPLRVGSQVDLLVALAGPQPAGHGRLAARRLPAVLAALARRELLPRGLPAELDASVVSRIARLVESAKIGLDARKLAVYAPPGNRELWGPPELCQTRPFLIPALAGVPMLMGIPQECRYLRSWGAFCCRDYDDASRNRRADPAELCRHAGRRGIESVLVLRSVSEPGRNEVLRCGRDPRG